MTKAYNVQVDNMMVGPKGIVIMWSGGIGFGEIALYKDEKGNILIDSEYMTQEFVEQVFKKLIDKAILK